MFDFKILKAEKGHIQHIETIRAIAASIVMLFHFISYNNGNDFIYWNAGVRAFSEWGAQGVEMFYIISGFVISYALYRADYSFLDYPRYVAKRVLRIVPPYFLTIFAIIGVSYALATFFWKYEYVFEWRNIFANMFYLADSMSNTSWINHIFVTLKVEIQFYLLIGLLFPFMKINQWYKYGIALVFLIIGAQTLEHYTVFFNAPYFVCGIILHDIYTNRGRNEISYGILVFLLAWLSYFYTYQDVVISALTIIFVLFLKLDFKWSNQLGRVSYSLYLTHGLFGGWFLFFTSRDEYINLSPYLIIPLACLLSIIGASVFYGIIEKPSIRWSKGILYKNKLKKS